MSPSLAAPATIVIVEDDAAVLSALGFALEMEGFHVRSFRTGAELQAVSDLSSAACLVIDQNLPDMAGLNLLAGLRERGVEVPAVVITTNPPPPVRAQAQRLNAPLIEKPLLGDQLFSAIRALAACQR